MHPQLGDSSWEIGQFAQFRGVASDQGAKFEDPRAYLAGIAIDGDQPAGQCFGDATPATDDSRPAELAAHHRGMAGRAAGLGDDAARYQHSVDIVGAGVVADQDHVLASVGCVDGCIHIGVSLTRCDARSGRQPGS